ncbi:MAG: efflux RND transporter periplasmic adaptor subunit [Caulobacteraceae bacterium]
MTAQNLDNFLGQKGVKRGRFWKWIWIAVGVLIVLFLLARCFAPPKPTNYATAPINRGDLTVTISATGNLAPTNQVNVGSQVSGLIHDVYVRNNDKVTKGQPLAQLDLPLLEAQVTQTQAALKVGQAAIAQAKATVEQNKATLARDEQVFQLSGGKVPSQVEMDVARADYARAVANVASAEAQVAQQTANVKTATTNLGYGTIHAPVTGVVLSRQVEPGQTVAAQFSVATLFTIAEDLSRMKIEVKVDEADIGELKEGAPAVFTVDAYPGRTFPATVTRVDVGANATPQVNSAGTTVANSSTVVAYTTVLSVANTDLKLKPGMTATALITVQHKSNVLLVPNAALRFNPKATPAAGGPPGAPPGGPGRGGVVIGPRQNNAGSNTAEFGRGARRQVWVVGPKGQPQPLSVDVGDTDGSMTEISGPGVQPGLKVITGQLTAVAAR